MRLFSPKKEPRLLRRGKPPPPSVVVPSARFALLPYLLHSVIFSPPNTLNGGPGARKAELRMGIWPSPAP